MNQFAISLCIGAVISGITLEETSAAIVYQSTGKFNEYNGVSFGGGGPFSLTSLDVNTTYYVYIQTSGATVNLDYELDTFSQFQDYEEGLMCGLDGGYCRGAGDEIGSSDFGFVGELGPSKTNYEFVFSVPTQTPGNNTYFRTPGTHNTYFPDGKLQETYSFYAIANLDYFYLGGPPNYDIVVSTTPIPEAPVWMLMMLGIGLVGAGMRSRRQANYAYRGDEPVSPNPR